MALGLTSSGSGNKSSSSNVPAPPRILAAERAVGGGQVVIDYELFDADGGCLQVAVEWAIESSESLTFRRATPHLGEAVALREGRKAMTSSSTCLARPPEGFQPFTYVWDAREDLRALSPPLPAARVRLRLTVDDETGKSNTQLLPSVVAGNEPPRILDLSVAEEDPARRGGLVELAARVADSTGDPTRLTGTFRLGKDRSGPMSIAFGEGYETALEEGSDHSIVWNSILESDVGRKFRTDVSLVIVPDDGFEEGEPTVLENLTLDNNEPPAVDIVPLSGAPDSSFEIPVRFIVSDPEEDRVSVLLQWAPADEAFREDVPLDDLNALGDLIATGKPELDALRRELRILTEAPRVVSGIVSLSGEPGRTDRVRLTDAVRQGLVFRIPDAEGTSSLPRGMLDRESGVFLAGLRVTISDPGGSEETATIVAFDASTSEALLDRAVQVLPGSSYRVRIEGMLDDLFSTQRGATHGFVWDCASDLKSTRLDGAVRIRALPFDAQMQVGAWSRERDLDPRSGPVVESQVLAAGNGPTFVLIEDLSVDGLKDLAVLSEIDLRVRVFLQSSEETLGDFASQELRIGTSPTWTGEVFSMAAGDIDGDPGADLVVAVSQGARSVLQAFIQATEGERRVLGNALDGETAREPSVEVQTRRTPSAVLVADLGDDTRSEIVVTSEPEQKVSLLKISGSSGLSLEEAFTLDLPSRPKHIAAGDLDGDGDTDLAVCGFRLGFQSSFISIFLRDGEESLGSSRAFPERRDITTSLGDGAGPRAIAIADLDSDPLKKRDLAVAFQGSGLCGVFLQPFLPSGETGARSFLKTGSGPVSIVAADLNGDGAVDLATANETSGSTTLFLQEEGRFAGEATQRIAVPSTVKSVAAGDLDGDGLSDLAAAVYESQAAIVYRQAPRGTILWESERTLLAGAALESVEVCDLNGDGWPDLAALSPDGRAFVYFQDDTGIMPSEPAVELRTGADPRWLIGGDLDGDGRNDLAVAARGEGAVEIFRQKPSGHLGMPGGSRDGKIDVANVTSVALADVSGDGRMDIVCCSQAPGGPQILLFLQEGAEGSFRSGPTLSAPGTPILVLAEDIDRDGRTDILSVNQEPWRGTASIYLQRPGGAFSSSPDRLLETLIQPQTAAITDVNSDGISDIIIGTFSNNRIHVFLGSPERIWGVEGGGVFTESCGLSANSPADHVAAGDIGGDGRSDIVVVTALDSKLGRFGGGGIDCRLTPIERVRFGVGPAWTVIEDVNGDGREDIVVASSKTATLSVLLGR